MAVDQVSTRLRLRPYAAEADLVEIARIENAEAAADGIQRRTTLGQLEARFGNASDAFDPARDVTVAELDGRIVAVGYREAVDTTDGSREYRLDGVVDPASRRRGIGRALLAENERISRDRILAEAPVVPVLGSWSWESQPGDRALLESAGYEAARWFFDMVRPTLDDAIEVRLPDGLEIRPIDRSLTRTVWAADIEAFADTWGGFDHSDAELQRWLNEPATDLSLWLIAFDGDEVAGGVISSIYEDQNETFGNRRGWLNNVFTRRPWRGRGLASALIAASLVRLRSRGMTSAALGVDAANPSGAVGLYERLGFKVDQRAIAWRKSLA